MVFGDRYNYQINKCSSVATKLAFSEKTYPFYCLTVILAYTVVISLLVGFNFLGFIKYISNYEDVRRVIQMSTTIIGLFCLPMAFWVIRTFKTTLSITEKSSNKPSFSEVSRFKNQVIAGLTTSGFIAGNVCYETLFAEANSEYLWQNQFYFFMMSFAFAFGVSAIVVSTLILLCLGELDSSDKKASFVVALRRAKLWIFCLAMSCILCWQASLLALSAVKYTGGKGGGLQSFVPGVMGLGALLWYYFRVKSVSDGIRENGRTVTAAALPAAAAGGDAGDDDGDEGGGAGDRSTTLANDPSTILNPLVIVEEGGGPARFQLEKKQEGGSG